MMHLNLLSGLTEFALRGLKPLEEFIACWSSCDGEKPVREDRVSLASQWDAPEACYQWWLARALYLR